MTLKADIATSPVLMAGFIRRTKERTFERSDNMASYKQLPDKSWQVRLSWVENGKRRQKLKRGFKRKSEAQIFATEFQKNIIDGISPLQKDTPFAEYFWEWYNTFKREQSSIGTQKRYENIGRTLQKYFKDRKISEIDRVDYQNFINYFGKNHAKHTVQKLNIIIRSCVKNAIYDDVIRKDFTRRIQLTYDPSRTRKVEYLSIKELHHLTASCITGLKPRYTSRYMILTAIMTGMRISEVMALTWDDIDFKWQTISINKSWDYQNGGGFKPTKNRSSVRTIRVNQTLLDKLHQLKGNDFKMVFKNQRGLIPSNNAINKTLRNILAELNIQKQDFNFHSLRHTHVAYLLSQGVDIYAISKRLGHSDLSTTTDIYAYLIDEYKEKNDATIISKLDELAG